MQSILLVDDDSAVCGVIRLHLEAAGYRVVCAADGLQAAEILAGQDFDLLLTDILMPNCDGLELIRQVHRKWPDLRVIAISGGGHLSGDLYLMLAKGFHVDGLLHKPFNAQELQSAIRTIDALPTSPTTSCPA